MNMIRKKIRQSFTLVEIIVAMSVFALLMLMIMQVFGAMQNVWSTTSSKTKTFQNARVIMDMIATDLQSAYYDANAAANNSWIYYQSGDFSNAGHVLWFVTHRQKSVQAKNSSLVQVGYWTEQVTRDGVDLLCLKNAVISNLNTALYNFKRSGDPDTKLPSLHSDVTDHAIILDNNILNIRIVPLVRIKDGGVYKTESLDYTKNDRLPAYIQIEMEMLDDDPASREKYSEGSDDDKKSVVRKFTRIIEIDRGQFYVPEED